MKFIKISGEITQPYAPHQTTEWEIGDSQPTLNFEATNFFELSVIYHTKSLVKN